MIIIIDSIIFLQIEILKPQDMEKVDELAKHVRLPPGVGAIPSSISSTSNSMKSDELKTWVLYISLYALKDSLPKSHFNMWQAFVRACKLLLKPFISVEETNHAHELLNYTIILSIV